jgi:sodium transport system permease protein
LNLDAHARLLNGFNPETATQIMALRGVCTEQLESVGVWEPDVAAVQARASRITSIAPLFFFRTVPFVAERWTFNCPHRRPAEG